MIRTFYVLFVIIYLLIAPKLYSQSIDNKENNIRFEFSLERINIKLSCGEILMDTVSEEGENYIIPRLGSDFGFNNKIGAPQLPVYYRLIELPFYSELIIRVNNSKISELTTTNRVMPYQPSKPKTNPSDEFIIDRKLYSRDEFIGNDIIGVEYLGQMGGTRLARIAVSPIRYNPISGIIELTQELDVDIIFEDIDLNKTKNLKSKYYNQSQELLNKKLDSELDYMLGEKSLLKKSKKMIILSDSMFAEVLQPFIIWKREKGIEVVEVYRGVSGVGTTAQAIRNYLKNLWDNSSSLNPSADYLLICGDTYQMPCFAGNTAVDIPSDLYYAEYTDDYLPELFYGRFPAQSIEEMKAMINKTIDYEKYNFIDDSYLNKTLLVAGKETLAIALTCNNGQMNYLKNNYLSNIPNLDTLVYYNPSSIGYSSQIIDSINKNGYSFINYSAHCNLNGWSNPNYTIFNVKNNVNNLGKYGFYINNCCLSNKFDENECFGESIIKAENKGGIGVIGGSGSTYWYEDFYWAIGAKEPSLNSKYDSLKLGAYDRWFHNNNESKDKWILTQGEIVQGGNLAVSQMKTERVDYYWEIYHLLGDPSLMPYVGKPKTMINNIPDSLAIGSNFLSFTSEPYAYIGISKDGVLLGASQADDNGSFSIALENPIMDSGYLKVVITKQFSRPIIDSIKLIIPLSPSVNISDIKIIDSLDNEVFEIKNNQTYSLRLRVSNLSYNSIDSLIILTSGGDCIDNFDSVYYIGQINGQSQYIINKDLRFRVRDGVKDGENLSLYIKIRGENNYKNYRIFNYQINSPKLNIENLSIMPFNNEYNVGDTILVNFDIKNIGGNKTKNGYVKLNILDNTLENLGDSLRLFNYIDKDNSYSLSYRIRINKEIKDKISFRTGVWAGNYYDVKLFSFSNLNKEVETFETNNFNYLSWINTYSKPWFIDNNINNVFEGNYSARSGKISNNQKSILSLKSNSVCKDSISFCIKVSSEKDYDIARFYIDGYIQIQLSGNISWTELSFPVSEGEHEFIWEYEKDYSTSYGHDAVWIDNIKIPLSGVVTNLETPSRDINNIELYPNPASSEFRINSPFDSFDIDIINSIGAKVFSKNAISNNQAINIKNVRNGIYYILIKSKGNLITKPLIIIN